MSLTGSARGATRADIITHAKDAAAKYYGETCIDVTLRNEETETVSDGRFNGGIETIAVGYTADWTAEVKHHIDQPTYGFAKCIHCKHVAER